MRLPLRQRVPLLFAVLLAGAATAGVAQPAPQAALAGRVLGKSTPLAAAGVYVYQLADLSLHKVTTDPHGNFSFRDLPAGLYKVIAHKAGFLPAVVLLTRTTAQSQQFVELQLAQATPGKPLAGEDFWSLRARIPADVLRDIETAEMERLAQQATADGASLALETAPFQAEMAAMTGFDQVPGAGQGQIRRGRVGIEGRLGDVQVGLSGDYWQLAPATEGVRGMALGDAQASAVSLEVEPGPSSHIAVSTRSSRLLASPDGGQLPAGLDQYQVSWSQALGENGRSQLAAQYTTESNYHRHGGIDPIAIPEASRTWGFQASYATALGDRGDLETGLRYRLRQAGELNGLVEPIGEERVDLFGRGGVRVQPAVLVEYGLYTTLRDGSLSLTPRGGVVVQLGHSWQAGGSVSQRVYDQPPALRGLPAFVPTLYQEPDTCEQSGDACYELRLARQSGEDDLFSVSAVQRTLGETLRLYFSEDVFDRFDSLYLVGGDRLREVQLTWTHRLSPQVLTKFESSVAEGGGGVFHATDGRPYENALRYAVSSLDTRFQATSTGVFVAFHQLAQELRPVAGAPPTPRKLERLQLQVSQDLNVLLDLAAEWAVQLSMELSRGATAAAPSPEDDEGLHRRILGGIAVKF